MDKTKHTAGPWTYSKGSDGWSVHEQGKWLARVIASGISNEKDAQLIAAAPVMLSTLVDLLTDLENNGEIYVTDNARTNLLEEAISEAGYDLERV
jgi:hypothetical protein